MLERLKFEHSAFSIRTGDSVRGRTAKTGATVAPVFGGRGSLPLLAALLLPALSSLLCHCALSPPSCGIGPRRAFIRASRVAADRHADMRLPALLASLQLPHAARERSASQKKSGVRKFPCVTPGPAAAVSASSRPFSCRPSQSSSPLVPPWNVAAQLVTGDQGLQQVG
jgi:hypothetical protein